MITRAKDIEEVQKDHEHFSMKRMLIPNIPGPSLPRRSISSRRSMARGDC